MVQNFNIDKFQVEQLENFADLLEGIEFSKEKVDVNFLTFIINIESLLPKSNIFDYIFKSDTYKNELEEIDKEMWRLKNRASDILYDIEQSELKIGVNNNEEIIFNEIKQKLIIEKKFNYGNI